ncbi:hypothetical protein I4U23_017574 [Adineta vaga]|nr:hypothetical protein I4U23_017574 [Adineta vaga]
MLLAIFNKLNAIDMFYSLVDVNQRFDRLALDPLFVYHLSFVIKPDDIHSSSADIEISRICSKILPRINEKITKLTLESQYFEYVINAVSYPWLHSLSLANYEPEILIQHLSDKTMQHLLTNQITHMIVDVDIENAEITRSISKIDRTRELLKLKHFSLTSDFHTRCYDTEVVPLLRRMLNLEELSLFLLVRSKFVYIDGDQLYDEILNYMPQLNKFIFHIHTLIMMYNLYMERFKSIDAFADDKLVNNMAYCHVYSLPYQFNELLYLSSCFQGGKFDNVRLLTMFDVRSFEHELFKIISQDFSFLQQLSIYNSYRQMNEQHHSCKLITFNHLFKLNISCAHDNYVTQFLSNKITRLPCLTNLTIWYPALLSVTKNFTNDDTRLNCSKIKYLVTHEPFVRSQNFVSYFPSL